MIIRSFGFDSAQPEPGAAWIADVRDIDVSLLAGFEGVDGLDPELQRVLLAFPVAQAWLRKFELDVMRELSDNDIVLVGCSTGLQVSVAIAEAFAAAAVDAGIPASLEHTALVRDTADNMVPMNIQAKSSRSWYEIKAAVDGVAEVYIYEQIGEDYWSEGITAVNFVSELNAITAPEIHLHINSPGGSVFDGVAIHNALKRHPAKVTTFIDGLAASIASIIAIAGDHVVMASNALFMIHNPWGGVQGDATEMRKMAEVLDKIGETLVNAYAERTGLDREVLLAAMNEETWYTADEALAAGFIDEVSSAIRAAASFDLSLFRHAPRALAEVVEPVVAPESLAEVGATLVQGSDGASGHVSPEAFIPGFGFHRFDSEPLNKE